LKRFNKVPTAGENASSDAAHVDDLMTKSAITITRHETLGAAQQRMTKHKIHSLPVVDGEGELIGVLTTTDLVSRPSPETLVGQIMSRDLHTIPRYSGLAAAARTMRKHKIHHLVVTHEKKVVGVLSSFDLLKLIEQRRFVIRGQA